MLQDNLIYLISLVAIGLIALLINYYISAREQRQEYRFKRLHELRRKSEDALITLTLLREANCRPDIVEKLGEYVISMIEEIAQLAPGSDLLEELSVQKENTDRITPSTTTFTNDRALKRAQIHIQHAERLLIEMTQLGKLNIVRAKQFQHELYWLHVCVFADAHIEQGNYFLEQGDKLIAMSHYKHAKAIIARTNVPQRQKQGYMDKLKDLLNAARPSSAAASGNLAASLDLLKEKE